MDLAFEIQGSLTNEFCEEIIKKFEEDDRKTPGKTVGGFNPDTKNSTDLSISNFNDWDEVTQKLDEALNKGVKEYDKFLEEKFDYDQFKYSETTNGISYQIQRSGFYKYHQDALVDKLLGRIRVLTYIWYLNTPEQGGETDFVYKKVKAEQGKLVLFPATWDYIHAGLPTPKKYIVTGWLHQPY